MTGIGELAALGTAIMWGIASHINSAVARETGATTLAMLRLPYMILLCGLFCVIFGAGTAISPQAVLLLGLSGFLGMAMGDITLYRAVLIIGPTMAILVLSLSSSLTAVMGWLLLHETLPARAILGIAVTLSGVMLAVLSHSDSILMPGQSVPRGKTLIIGVLWATVASFGVAIGYVAQRMAMQTGVDPLWGGFVRAAGGGAALWAMGAMCGWCGPAVRCFIAQPRPRRLLLLGAVGGAGGVWAASYALAHAPAGVAATIIGLQPVIVALVGAAWYRRRPSFRVLAGVALAFTGTALVCLR